MEVAAHSWVLMVTSLEFGSIFIHFECTLMLFVLNYMDFVFTFIKVVSDSMFFGPTSKEIAAAQGLLVAASGFVDEAQVTVSVADTPALAAQQIAGGCNRCGAPARVQDTFVDTTRASGLGKRRACRERQVALTGATGRRKQGPASQ